MSTSFGFFSLILDWWSTRGAPVVADGRTCGKSIEDREAVLGARDYLRQLSRVFAEQWRSGPNFSTVNNILINRINERINASLFGNVAIYAAITVRQP